VPHVWYQSPRGVAGLNSVGGIEIGKESLSFVNCTVEELIERLQGTYRDYVDRSIEESRKAYEAAKNPVYKDNVLYILVMKVKKVYTDKPMTRLGLSGPLIASRVLPAVWEMTGGDKDKYLKFFADHIVPLGVTAEDLVSFDLSEQDMLAYAEYRRAEEGRLC
jgi:hypothetical protein